jgi:diguanylate cyclase (GGDEF)-like protein
MVSTDHAGSTPFRKADLRRLFSILLSSSIVGIALIATIWVSVIYHLNSVRDRTVQATTENVNNLAHVFEIELIRTLSEADRMLKSLRISYLDKTFTTDLNRLAGNVKLLEDTSYQIFLMDSEGIVRASSLGPITKVTDASDREHFRVHRDNKLDELYISKPFLGRISGRWTIALSRAIRESSGALLAVLTVSVDPMHWIRLYDSVAVGPDGAVVLAGTDGIVRASRGLHVSELGLPIGGTDLYSNLLRQDSGTFTGDGPLDNVRRLTAYRTAAGFPMIISVGLAESDFLAGYMAVAWRLYVTAALASGLILLLALFASWIRLQRERAQAELAESRARAMRKSRELTVTLDHMHQGIFMADADGEIAVMNRRAVKMLDLPDKMMESHPTHAELLDYMWKSGEFGNEGDSLDPEVRERIRSGARRGEVESYERVRPNGTVLQLDSEYLPDGSLVRTITDITARKEAESRLARMALHDSLTDLPNRVLLNRQLELSFARARRHGEGFAVHCLDLDGFKKVNDTLGHHAGDLLLQEIASRLRKCVRDLDMVSRTGGDEFVIIQAAVVEEELASVLADRVRLAVGRPFTIEGSEVAVEASIGIAFAPRHGANALEICRNGDLALYRAKSSGRNQVCFYSEQSDTEMPAELLKSAS